MNKKNLLLSALKSLFEKQYNLLLLTIAFLSLVPIFEIVIYKQLVDIVIEGFSQNVLQSNTLIYLIFLILLLISVAGMTYYFKILRIKFINLLSIKKQQKQKLKAITINWYRASLLESSLIIVGLGQIFLVLLLTIYLSKIFSIIFIFFIAIALILTYKRFIIEINNQINFIRKEHQLKRSQSSNKILSRIVSSESSSFLASIMMYLVLLSNFIFLYFGYIDQSQFIAFVFVAKYLGGSFGMLSSSMMRLARSLAYTKKVFLTT